MASVHDRREHFTFLQPWRLQVKVFFSVLSLTLIFADLQNPFPVFLFRSLELVYQRPGEMKGIPLYRYVAPKTMFANGTDYAPNEGFCPCRQSGLLNVSSCRHSESVYTHIHLYYLLKFYTLWYMMSHWIDIDLNIWLTSCRLCFGKGKISYPVNHLMTPQIYLMSCQVSQMMYHWLKFSIRWKVWTSDAASILTVVELCSR